MSHFAPLRQPRAGFAGLRGTSRSPLGAETGVEGKIEQTAQPQAGLTKDFRELPQVFAFFYWWLKDTPQRIVKFSLLTIKKLFFFFSIDLLLKTLLEPWKRDEIDTTNMSLQSKLNVLLMNIVSRLVGAVVRGGTVVFALALIAATFILAVVSTVGFIFLPVICAGLIIIVFV